jgi:hypothetical protein
MNNRLLIPLSNGRWLALTHEQFVEAEQAGHEFFPTLTPNPPVPGEDSLLTAEQLEQRTSVPASWWEQAARENRVPHVRIGRYVRFRFGTVAEHFSRALDSELRGAIRQWRRTTT